MAELGTRYGLITPYTSYYVPSARELAQMGEEQARLMESELLPGPAELRRSGRPSKTSRALAAMASVVSAPLAITGCGFLSASDSPAPGVAGEAEVEDWVSANQSDDEQGGRGKRHLGEEGQMGRQEPATGDNRYGIKGPAADPSPAVAQQRADELTASSDRAGAEASRMATESPPEPSPAPTPGPPAATVPLGRHLTPPWARTVNRRCSASEARDEGVAPLERAPSASATWTPSATAAGATARGTVAARGSSAGAERRPRRWTPPTTSGTATRRGSGRPPAHRRSAPLASRQALRGRTRSSKAATRGST